MTLNQFEALYDLETMIRDYKSECELLEENFLHKDRPTRLSIDLALHRPLPFDMDPSNPYPLPETTTYQIFGSGSHDKSDNFYYSHNARIMYAGLIAMVSEMNIIISELEAERDKLLNS